MEQLTADKKNLHQEGKDAENDDTSREEDCKKPTEEGPTQENTLRHEKTELLKLCENKGHFTGQRPFYISGSYGFLILVNQF